MKKASTAKLESFETDVVSGNYSGAYPCGNDIYAVSFGQLEEQTSTEDAWAVNFARSRIITGIDVETGSYISEFYMYG